MEGQGASACTLIKAVASGLTFVPVVLEMRLQVQAFEGLVSSVQTPSSIHLECQKGAFSFTQNHCSMPKGTE
jgi:hypothetical protein